MPINHYLAALLTSGNQARFGQYVLRPFFIAFVVYFDYTYRKNMTHSKRLEWALLISNLIINLTFFCKHIHINIIHILVIYFDIFFMYSPFSDFVLLLKCKMFEPSSGVSNYLFIRPSETLNTNKYQTRLH